MIKNKVTGYLELEQYPDFPAEDVPSKDDCLGYQFISMVQLCNIAEALGISRSQACNAFGGDNGDIPVQPDRQAWVWSGGGHRRKKFVLIRAMQVYFLEIGLPWR